MQSLELLRKIRQKIYYKFANLKTPFKKVVLTQELKRGKNIFIYFDYERNFGGQDTTISDKDVSEIIRILDSNNIKTTWFTVGKIFEHYPESVKEIIDKGHEIGSHTYSHIPPLDVSVKVIKDDFIKFKQASSMFKSEVLGFHSPGNMWSLKNIKFLREFNFKYDLIHCKQDKKCNPVYLGKNKNKQILRLYTLGDDWPVFKKNQNEQQIFDYFTGLSDRINYGEIAGIGFHPWVLFSEKSIIAGFRSFIKYLASSEEYCIKPAKNFVADIIEFSYK